jgi:serine protease Do
MIFLFSIFLISASLNLLGLQSEIKRVYKDVLPEVITLVNENSVGGGVLYDSTGLIVTSLPFPQMETYKIVDFEGDTSFARILYWDELTHLGFLKGEFNVKGLRKASNLEEGDFAIIIGNSSGIENCLILSIISKKDERRVYLQGDISPGQIGSPVFNIKGEFVGVVKGKLVEFKEEEKFPFFFSRNSNLISVIPWNVIEEVKENVGKHRFRVPGWLGVLIKDSGKGVVIKKVFPGSPAEKANLKEGDIILEIESEKVRNMRVLLDEIKRFSPGENLELKIKRGGDLITTEVRLGKRPYIFPY